MVTYKKGDLMQYQIPHIYKYLKIQAPDDYQKFIQIKSQMIRTGKVSYTGFFDYSDHQISTTYSSYSSFSGFDVYGDYYLNERTSISEILKRPSLPAWDNFSVKELELVKKPIITILSDRFAYPKTKIQTNCGTGFYRCLVVTPGMQSSQVLYLSEVWLEPLISNEYWQQHFDSLAENQIKAYLREYCKKLVAQ
jgi:hypothetical protein